jgi:hypothetical protein
MPPHTQLQTPTRICSQSSALAYVSATFSPPEIPAKKVLFTILQNYDLTTLNRHRQYFKSQSLRNQNTLPVLKSATNRLRSHTIGKATATTAVDPLQSSASLTAPIHTVAYAFYNPTVQEIYMYKTLPSNSGIMAPPPSSNSSTPPSSRQSNDVIISAPRVLPTSRTYISHTATNSDTLPTSHLLPPLALDHTLLYHVKFTTHQPTNQLDPRNKPTQIPLISYENVIPSPTSAINASLLRTQIQSEIHRAFNQTRTNPKFKDALFQPISPLNLELIHSPCSTSASSQPNDSFDQNTFAAHLLIASECFFLSLPIIEYIGRSTERLPSIPGMFMDCLLRWDPFRDQHEMSVARLIAKHIDTHHATLSREIDESVGSHYMHQPLPTSSDDKCRCPVSYLDFSNVPSRQTDQIIGESQFRLELIERLTSQLGIIAPLTAAKYFHSFEYRISQLCRRSVRFQTNELCVTHDPRPFIHTRSGQIRPTRIVRSLAYL